ncbi:hypothetical protein L228DRAFT_244499 [Xylona heveae TC161]|uniref:Extracellular membrane protein CFEM domain-containing protein n=1 Tax=Xylona heveae (strain CBS 132557 / TC161) TaxID=1328760 RepID=A0A165J1N9_XYLHT|nr:hypothetical protein L228DRAFT_244499 [Xylona heveae TC161]KZF25621.1 hypothetical protein L228DRAFT_244499 [Xylona heveae TC161]
MQYLTGALIFISAASVALGQSTASSSCAAQNILDACLATENTQLGTCQSNDYKCLCDKYTNVLTCYNNCPGDSGKFSAQQNVVANCNAASVYATLTAKKTSELSSLTDLAKSATSKVAAAASSLTSKYGSTLGSEIKSLSSAAKSRAGAAASTATATSHTGTGKETSAATATGSKSHNAASGLVVGLGRGGMGAAVALVGLGGLVVGWGIGGF